MSPSAAQRAQATTNDTPREEQSSLEDPSSSDAEALAGITALEANALYETGRETEAKSAARAALVLDPENQTALTVLALISESGADWRDSAASWDEVARVSQDVEAADFARNRADEVARRNGAFGTLDAFFFGDAGDDEQFGLSARGRIARQRGPSVLVGLEARRLKDDEVFVPPGGPQAIEEDRITGRAGLEFYPDIGRTRIEVIGNSDVVGLIGGIEREGQDFVLNAEASFNRPFFDFSASVLFDAALDEIVVSGGRNVGRAFVDGRLGARNYTIEDREDAAESTLVSAGVSYRLGDEPTAVRLATRFDGEFVSGERFIERGGRRPIRAIPVRDREIVSLGVYKRFEPNGPNGTYFDLGAGYREDLDRADGLFVRGEGGIRITPDLTLEIDAEYSDVSTNRVNADAFTAVTVSLKRTFPSIGRRT